MTVNIASSTKLPQDEAIEIAELLRDNYHDEETRSEYFDIFVQLYVLECLFARRKRRANLPQYRRAALQDSVRRRYSFLC